jgi:hypothetical protein
MSLCLCVQHECVLGSCYCLSFPTLVAAGLLACPSPTKPSCFPSIHRGRSSDPRGCWSFRSLFTNPGIKFLFHSSRWKPRNDSGVHSIIQLLYESVLDDAMQYEEHDADDTFVTRCTSRWTVAEFLGAITAHIDYCPDSVLDFESLSRQQ